MISFNLTVYKSRIKRKKRKSINSSIFLTFFLTIYYIGQGASVTTVTQLL